MIPSCDHLSTTKLSEQKKMEEDQEGDLSLSLVECLRGRLIVERAASKAAKQDEHLMDSKLKEVEAKLRDETKARKRFEKKLILLKKKLQSLKLPSNLEDSSNSDASCISSVASTDDPLQQEASPITPISEKDSADSETDSLRPKLEMDDQNEDGTSRSEVDDSMALVPLSFHEDYSDANEVVQITSENVRDVLGTLKNIREEIQRTMQRRQATTQMIQVG